jgi:hypothetical protein
MDCYIGEAVLYELEFLLETRVCESALNRKSSSDPPGRGGFGTGNPGVALALLA